MLEDIAFAIDATIAAVPQLEILAILVILFASSAYAPGVRVSAAAP
jgi:hypothetical protein